MSGFFLINLGIFFSRSCKACVLQKSLTSFHSDNILQFPSEIRSLRNYACLQPSGFAARFIREYSSYKLKDSKLPFAILCLCSVAT